MRGPCFEGYFLSFDLVFYKISKVSLMWHKVWSLLIFSGHFIQLTLESTTTRMLHLTPKALAHALCATWNRLWPHSFWGKTLFHFILLFVATETKPRPSPTWQLPGCTRAAALSLPGLICYWSYFPVLKLGLPSMDGPFSSAWGPTSTSLLLEHSWLTLLC